MKSAIAALGAAAMFALDLRLGVWADEGYTLATTDDAPLAAGRRALRYEQYPPLYFVALAAWRKLNRSPQFARLYSTLVAMLAVREGAAAIALFAPEIEPEAATAAIALHWQTLWSGSEARAYPQLLWLSAKMLRAYHRAYIVPTGPRARLAFVASAVAAVYTHYYGGFVVAGCGIALVLHERRSLVPFALDAAAIGLALVPLVQAIRAQMDSQEFNFPAAMPPLKMLRASAGTLAAFTLPSEHAKQVWRPLIGALVAALAVTLSCDGRSRRAATVPMTVAVAAMSLFSISLQVAGISPILPVHATAMMVPVVVAVAATLRTARRTRIYAALVAALGLNAALATFVQGAKPGDWRRVGVYLRRHAAPGEPVFVFHSEATLALRHHVDASIVLTAIPEEIAFDRYDLRRYAIRDESHVEAAFARADIGHSAWLVTTTQTRTLGVDFHVDHLERYVALRYRVTEDHHFSGSRLRRLVALTT